MNQCYTLPGILTNQKWYEGLRARIEKEFKEEKIDFTLTAIVPKKLARCIFVEKGILHRKYFME